MEINTTLLRETMYLAENLLTKTYARPVQLSTGTDMGGGSRSHVFRFQILDAPQTIPANVIVKRMRTQSSTWTFLNDWASLQFLEQLCPHVPLAPHFYAGDLTNGLFIMEDLGQGKRLDHLLLGNDPLAAENALLEFATIHGRLHALTIDQQTCYMRIRGALGSTTDPLDYYNYKQWLAPTFRLIADTLAIPLAPEVDDELSSLSLALSHPGPFLTFIQGDSCPDNIMYTGASMRMLDFEGGWFTHALIEGVYGRVPFPGCWCSYRMPEAIKLRMETAYRNALVQGCSAAADDTLFYHAVVEACVSWAIRFHFMRPLSSMLEQDRTLVALSDRQRFLLFLNSALQACATFNHLPAIATALHMIIVRLNALWPEAIDPPYFPAFS